MILTSFGSIDRFCDSHLNHSLNQTHPLTDPAWSTRFASGLEKTKEPLRHTRRDDLAADAQRRFARLDSGQIEATSLEHVR